MKLRLSTMHKTARLTWLMAIILPCLAAVLPMTGACGATQGARPNIIFVLTDDFGWGEKVWVSWGGTSPVVLQS